MFGIKLFSKGQDFKSIRASLIFQYKASGYISTMDNTFDLIYHEISIMKAFNNTRKKAEKLETEFTNMQRNMKAGIFGIQIGERDEPIEKDVFIQPIEYEEIKQVIDDYPLYRDS